MKLRELDVENFGIFSNSQFSLSDGLQLIYGPNEAGKSTLLQLIRETLFGFPGRNPYSFDSHVGELAVSAVLEMADGRGVEYRRRRKGRKDEVVGRYVATGQAIDATALSRLLGGASPELYQHVFGFSLEELASGEKSLSRANMDEALYGGALGGLASLEATMRGLAGEHESLYTPAARKKPINERLAAIKQAAKELREAAVSPQQYTELKTSVEALEARETQLDHEVAQLRARQDHLRALLEALNHWQELAIARRRLATMDVPDSFPADAARRLQDLRREDHINRTELQSCEEELDACVAQRTSIVVDEKLLAEAPEIRSLAREVDKIIGFRNDVGPRGAEAAAIRDDVLQRIRAMNPEWSLSDLDTQRGSLEQRSAVDRLSEEFLEIDRHRVELQSQRRIVRRDLAATRRQLSESATDASTARLKELVAGADQYLTESVELRECERQRTAAEAHIQNLERRLSDPLPQRPDPLPALRVPMKRTVDEYRHELAEIQRPLAQVVDRIQEFEQELAKRERESSELQSLGDVPDRNALAQVRSNRNAHWERLRLRLTADPTKSSAPDSREVELFEAELCEADRVADVRYENAELVARRDQLADSVRSAQQRLDDERKNERRLQRTLRQFDSRWNALWEPCGFEPLSPSAMLEWLQTYSEYQQAVQELQPVQRLRDELRHKTDQYIMALRQEVDLPDASPDSLLDESRRQVERAAENARRQADLSERTTHKQAELDEISERFLDLDERDGRYRDDWAACLKGCGFPSTWQPKVAATAIGELTELQAKMNRANELDERAADMRAGLEQFDARVRNVGHRIAFEREGRPEDIVVECNRRLDLSVQAESESRQLDKEIQRLVAGRDARRRRCANNAQAVQALFDEVDVDGEATFVALAQAAEEQRDLNRRVAGLQQQIEAARRDTPAQEFVAALAAADRDQIQADLALVEQQLDHARRDHKQVVQDAAVQRTELSACNGQSRAVEVAGRLESSRGELRRLVDRWVPLVVAQTLLRQSIERFQHEHRPAMLDHVSKLLDRMTDGRYVAIRQKMDEQGTLQVVMKDGSFRLPAELSTGTREQLYLAIRLAYVAEYCRDTEPLPLVMDDVLVNFDDQRARQTLEVLVEASEHTQIIFMTCHQSMVDLAERVHPGHEPLVLWGAEWDQTLA